MKLGANKFVIIPKTPIAPSRYLIDRSIFFPLVQLNFAPAGGRRKNNTWWETEEGGTADTKGGGGRSEITEE